MGVKDSATAVYQVESESAHVREEEVPRGYKRTEVGIIPEDWELVTLLSLADGSKERFDDGDWIEAEYLTESGVRLIQTGNIGIGSFVDKEPRKYISQISFDKLRCKDVYEGDLLVCRLAEPAGRACIVPRLDAERAITAVDVTIFRPIPERGNRTFLLHYFCTNAWFAEVNDRCGGSTRSRIARGALGQIKVPTPTTKAEQEAIADALGDADALIESLQQLIAKKRSVKQGAVQDLLTGRKRLPGFTGEWQTKRLDELFTFSGGFSASRDQLGAQGHCYLHYGDIHTTNRSFVDVGSEAANIPKLDVALSHVPRDSMLDDGDVVFVDVSEDEDGASKHVVVSNPDRTPFISGLHTIVAKAKTDDLERSYRRYCFQTDAVRAQFRFFAVGTKVLGVSKGNIGKIELRFPPRPEQTAIATVLSDMDAEIEALEARLAKTRALKAGMMQALLTGRIRLPLDRAA